ncbi:MAG: hypothetical protein ACLQQ4_18365 [Bacteroidia bacterium]
MKKIICACVILLCACNPQKQKGLVYFNDFESIKGWAPVNLSKKYFHSGMYSNKIDSVNTFGLTFRQSFWQISEDKIARVKVSFWTYLTDKAQGKLVMEVRRLDNSLALWTGKNIADLAPRRGEWQRVETSFTVPDSLRERDNIISIYPWNISKSDFYVDDFRIEFVLGY